MRAYAPVHIAELQDLVQSANGDNPEDALKRAANTLNSIVNPSNVRTSGTGRVLSNRRSARLGFPMVESETTKYDEVVDELDALAGSAPPVKAKASTKKDAGKPLTEKEKAEAAKDAATVKSADRAAATGPVAVGAAQQRINEQTVKGGLDVSMDDVFQIIRVIVNLIRGFRNQG